jgi:hypothetical protein
MLPFFEIPRPPDVKGPPMDDPKLVQLKYEVKVCSCFMFGVPLFVFFYIRSTYRDYLHPDENMYAGLAAVLATNITMFCIAVWKYWEDFKAVFIDGTGDIPYDPALRDAINTDQ